MLENSETHVIIYCWKYQYLDYYISLIFSWHYYHFKHLHGFCLKKQVVSLQNELSYVQAHLATLELPQPPPATVTSSGSLPPLSISDLPTITPSMYDLSPILEPISSTWPMQQQPRPSDHLFGVSQSSSIGGGGEFQAIAREFLHGGQMSAHQPPPETGGSAPTVIKREWCLYFIYIYICWFSFGPYEIYN